MKYISHITLHISREKFSNGNATLCRSQSERWLSSGKRLCCFLLMGAHPQLGINFSPSCHAVPGPWLLWLVSLIQEMAKYQFIPAHNPYRVWKCGDKHWENLCYRNKFYERKQSSVLVCCAENFCLHGPNMVSLYACSTFCLSRWGLAYVSSLSSIPSSGRETNPLSHIFRHNALG